ncbi:MAG: hypothetical protein PHG64_12160 [Paludibacter sp.]|nr:hypothetical protein [Paludibacter sp.]
MLIVVVLNLRTSKTINQKQKVQSVQVEHSVKPTKTSEAIADEYGGVVDE